ncbi:hypothetical protein [Paracoccus sp. (in: a-proteobacteria)]|uniref:hypothetical protein n=1 Tax=Paracoccus sp. TaxID=267 RepID=UPI002AFFBDF6|nr:hypothetical protein [Paracoccus sp. (in: a-proteobacteria)]
MNRRDLIKAAPVALVGCAMPVQAETETPVAALFREWMRLCAEEAAAYAADPEGEGQACEAATDRKLAVERQLRDAPKLNLADLGLAVMATTEFSYFGVPCDVRDRYRADARVMVEGTV